MDNFFNKWQDNFKLNVRVHIYHILRGIWKIYYGVYRSQMDYIICITSYCRIKKQWTMIWYKRLLTVCLCCGYSFKETADFTFSAHDMFLEFYLLAIINVLYMYTVSDCHVFIVTKHKIIFFFFFSGGSMSCLIGLLNNSYKPITNTAWVRAWLCKLQERV